MKKVISILSVLLLTLLIAACGSSEKETSNDDQVTDSTNSSEANGSEEKENSSEATGTSVDSDNQEYSISVLDGYELTAEEPNKDLLFNKENEEQSMRIEVYNASEVNMADVTNELVETVKASNSEGNVTEITDKSIVPSGKQIEDVKSYKAEIPDGNNVYGYTFLQDGLGVKLTVFDTAESPAIEDFIKMANTIKIN
ncbi:hypothetical protein NSQ95_05400 [Psychrobacillus sp. FSL W7-1457]|uniref:hypothetical protein n=1 Tax=unclassified Psychrobacillus TaxID=2636677 RepID=UPI0030F8DAB7